MSEKFKEPSAAPTATAAPSQVEPRAHVLPARPATGRGVVDCLLQGALVELFAAYGVALAPLPRDGRQQPELVPSLSAVIGFTASPGGAWANTRGQLTLSVPGPVLDGMERRPALGVRPEDWVRELVNQLMGRVKNRFLPYGARLQAGIPSSIGGAARQPRPTQGGTLRVYRARTLRGEVVTTLDASLDESEIAYLGRTHELAEGELILF